MDPTPRRRRNLARCLKPAGLDAMLVTNPLNVRYLCGFAGGASFLLRAPKRAVLFSDARFTQQIAEECPGLEADIRGHDRDTWRSTAEGVAKLGFRKVGFEGNHLTVASLEYLKGLAPSVDWAPISGEVEKLRAVKDASEIDTLREAVRIAERTFHATRALLRPGDTEKDVFDAVESHVRRAGGDHTAFETIPAVGDRSALPHAPPTSRAVAESPFMLLDWGAAHHGYHSDLTRVFRTGSPGEGGSRAWSRLESKLRPIYTSVLMAQRAASGAVKPGVHVREVDKAARGVIDGAGYGGLFNHGLGHGLGLEIHESPSIRSNSEDVLEAGMVITLEPGVYVPDFGGVRLEDDFLVTPDGCERLSSLPQEWDEFFE